MQSRDERRGRGECRNRGECRRGDAETSGRPEPETRGRAEPEEQRRKTRVEQRRKGVEVQRRKGAKAQKLKPEEFREKEKIRDTSRNAGEKRSYIGSARASGARGDCSHAHTKKDPHLASLTPVTGATHARRSIKLVRAQRRLRGNPQTRNAYDCAM